MTSHPRTRLNKARWNLNPPPPPHPPHKSHKFNRKKNPNYKRKEQTQYLDGGGYNKQQQQQHNCSAQMWKRLEFVTKGPHASSSKIFVENKDGILQAKFVGAQRGGPHQRPLRLARSGRRGLDMAPFAWNGLLGGRDCTCCSSVWPLFRSGEHTTNSSHL